MSEEVQAIPERAQALQNKARVQVTTHAGCQVRWHEWCERREGDGEREGIPLVALHGGHGSWLHWLRNIDA